MNIPIVSMVRPGSTGTVAGQIRFNPTTSMLETYDGGNWVATTSIMAQQEMSELKIEVGSVAGIVYNCIRPIGKPWQEMMQWCVDIMGACGNEFNDVDIVLHARWYLKDGMFWFKDPEDRVMFVLRWS